MVLARKIVLKKRFDGLPKGTDFEVIKEELPALKNGEYLVEALYLSVDPYMRAFAASINVGDIMIGSQVGKVTDSKSYLFPVGSLVVGHFGWRTHTIASDKPKPGDLLPTYILPDLGDLSPSLSLGVLGMPGNTSYFGFLEICKPKSGETVVVSGAAGAVGSHVGQIAKNMGCRVIGIAGSDKKCQWLKTLGFDKTINYKTENVEKALQEAAPEGVDCYFDNVGGEISSIVMYQMNSKGRVSVCGSISAYNDAVRPKATILQPAINTKELRIEGFMVSRWADQWMEGIKKNMEWIRENKLIFEETITDGFSNMPKAFIEMLTGENTGKAVVKV